MLSAQGKVMKGAARFPSIINKITASTGLAAYAPTTVLNWGAYGEKRMETATVVDTTSFAYVAIKAEALQGWRF